MHFYNILTVGQFSRKLSHFNRGAIFAETVPYLTHIAIYTISATDHIAAALVVGVSTVALFHLYNLIVYGINVMLV